MKTLKAFEADFPNEDACKKLLAECRWPMGRDARDAAIRT